MRCRRHREIWRSGRTALLLGVALVAITPNGLMGADARPEANPSAGTGRRLILVYGDKQVDLRVPPTTEPEKTEADQPELDNAAVASPKTKILTVREGLQPPRATWQAGQDWRDSADSRQSLHHWDRDAAHRANVLRLTPAPVESDDNAPPAPAPLTDLPQPPESLELPTEAKLPLPPVPDAPSPPAQPPLDTAGTDSQPAAAATPVREAEREPSPADRVDAATANQPVVWWDDPAGWLAQRLGILVVVLLGAVVCLILVVVQLLLAVRKFAGKLVPTIRLEMGQTGLVPPYLTAGYGREGMSARPDRERPSTGRAGAVADLAEATIPFELLSGAYQQEREAEEARMREQEQAILQEIFEENIALRERMRPRAV